MPKQYTTHAQKIQFNKLNKAFRAIQDGLSNRNKLLLALYESGYSCPQICVYMESTYGIKLNDNTVLYWLTLAKKGGDKHE